MPFTLRFIDNIVSFIHVLCSAHELKGDVGLSDHVLTDFDFEALSKELELGADFPSAGLLS